MEKGISCKLVVVQSDLIAPKNQFNSFGKYNYRSCEDIVEAVQPLLAKQKLSLLLYDEVVEVGGRVYVKATATIRDDENSISASAYAREPEMQKGMNDAQITGATSSYARKYALNGLFAIDDTKDADTKKPEDNDSVKPKTSITTDDITTFISACASEEGLEAYWKENTRAIKGLPKKDYDKVVAEFKEKKEMLANEKKEDK